MGEAVDLPNQPEAEGKELLEKSLAMAMDLAPLLGPARTEEEQNDRKEDIKRILQEAAQKMPRSQFEKQLREIFNERIEAMTKQWHQKFTSVRKQAIGVAQGALELDTGWFERGWEKQQADLVAERDIKPALEKNKDRVANDMDRLLRNGVGLLPDGGANFAGLARELGKVSYAYGYLESLANSGAVSWQSEAGEAEPTV